MKRIKILLLLFFLATDFSMNAMSPNGGKGHHDGWDKGKHGGNVGVPLDGGLLTVLGVAGVGYYTARKKGKKLES